MINKGRDTTKGIIYQQTAAMALFLQYLKKNDFDHIHLEAEGSRDFDLVFNDNRKIICEAKYWKRQFSSNHLLRILSDISKKIAINEKDEILIIARNIGDTLISNVSNYKYWPNRLKHKFHGYSVAEKKLLPRVKFWQVDQQSLEMISLSLFLELLNFWLPQEDLDEKLKSILIDKMYVGSAKGGIYTKKEFFANLESISYKLIKKSTLFNEKYRSLEEQFRNIIVDIKKNKQPRWGDYDMGALSAQTNKMFFVLNQIKNEKINLQRWNRLWKASSVYPYYFRMFDIFSNNLDIKSNQSYALKFLVENIAKMKEFYRSHFFQFDTVKIVSKIIEKNKNYLPQILHLIKELLKNYTDEDFYIKDKQNSDSRKQEICKLMGKIYENVNKKLKDEIISFARDYFNLVEDQGEFSHYTPVEIFTILYKHLTSDWKLFERNFMKLTKDLADQYEKFYKRFGAKVTFDGWELMGGSTAFSGGNYRIDDRHFVAYVLEPALYKYYTENRGKGWSFIKKHCIICDDDVDKKHPDFLNRAALEVILERYKQSDRAVSNEAFEILKDFVLRRKGIPHKSELIYQALKGDFSHEKKWELLNVILEKYKRPTNPFVECIVSELANKGHKQAKETFANWARNSDYYKKTDFLGRNITQYIDKLLDTSFDDAIKIFKDYINNEYFINELDDFDAYKVAGLLGKILTLNFNIGVEMLERLQRQEKELSDNQQILLGFGVLGAIDKKADDLGFVRKIYNEFMNPFFAKFGNDINAIVKAFRHGNAREAFVQIAEKLARDKLIKEALRIIEIFVNDPDPFLPGEDPEDREAKYSHHKKIDDGGQGTCVINSVRGWCAWTLAHCIVLEGREYLCKIIELTKQLAEDKDYYVQHMACFPLSRLVRYRLSHIPEDKNVLFFNDDKRTALEWAKKVETITQTLLDKIIASNPNVQKALAKSIMSVVGSIRTLNEKEAMELIEKLGTFPDEEISEITPLLLYYAEFREDSYKDWRWSLPGLYDELHPFDSSRLKTKIREIMLKNSETRAAFAWKFYQMTDSALRKIKDSLDYDEAFDLAMQYIPELISEYNHRTFETLYRFIDENIKQPGKFDICYKLWLECLKQEKPALELVIKDGKVYDVYWWPYHYNGNILVLLNQKKGQKAFLDAFEFLSEYPKEADIGGIKDAVELMKKIPLLNKQVEKIFSNLIERNAIFYNDKQQWLKQKN